MSQHEREINSEQEQKIKRALAEDTQSIQSPVELDQQILAQASAQAETNLRARRKQRFRFWQYSAAASAAGLVVLSSWLITYQPESQPVEPTLQQRSMAPTAPPAQEVEMADAMPAAVHEKAALQSARAKSPAVKTVDCTQLTIPQALDAQQRYINRSFRDDARQKEALQHIAGQRALYEKLKAENGAHALPVTWRANWWQAYQQYEVTFDMAPAQEAQYTCEQADN